MPGLTHLTYDDVVVFVLITVDGDNADQLAEAIQPLKVAVNDDTVAAVHWAATTTSDLYHVIAGLRANTSVYMTQLINMVQNLLGENDQIDILTEDNLYRDQEVTGPNGHP